MKKTISWLIIVFCSLFLILFIAFLIIAFLAVESMDSIPQFITAIAGYIFMIALTILGIRYGIKQLRPKKQVEGTNYTKSLSIHFKGQINYKEYRNLILGLTFGKPLFLFFLLIIIASLITSLTTGNSNTIPNNTLILSSIFIGLIFLSPLLTLFRINKTYKTSNIFREELSYTINNESIHIKGNTIDSNQKWPHFYKIKETKAFFMLYQSDNVATLIEKKMLSQNDLNELRVFLQSLNKN